MWILYQIIYLFGFLLYLPGALWRKRLPHRGWTMRLGRYPRAVRERLGARRAIWVHAVSVGEVLAAQPLVQALAAQHGEDAVVVSTITPGGFDVAAKRAGERVVPVFFPLDLRVCAEAAFNALRPRILILMESELWPMAIRVARARGVPVVLVNGRISPRTWRRSRWARPWWRGMLSRIDRFLMQSQEDASRIIALGAAPERVQVTGSLKWDASLGARPPIEDVQRLRAQLGLADREDVIVAGSTHRGEEVALLRAWEAVRRRHPETRLVIAPRHLERLGEVEALVRAAGHPLARLSQISGQVRWHVGLVDTFGQLPRYYGLATAVFIGGSLIPHGGQNPLEAASLGKPTVFGPSMHNFAVIAHELLAHHAARQVAGAEELTRVLEELLRDAAGAAAMGARAQELTERFRGATQRSLEALSPLLVGADWPAGYG